MQLASTFSKKPQITYEHAIANASTYGRIEPLKFVILAQVTYKINPS
jgi:hypothetical protein